MIISSEHFVRMILIRNAERKNHLMQHTRFYSSRTVARFIGVSLWAGSALAVPPPMTMTVDADNPAFNNAANTQQDGVFGFMTGISRSSSMLGNMWGVRPWLGQYGMTFSLEETSEDFGQCYRRSSQRVRLRRVDADGLAA